MILDFDYWKDLSGHQIAQPSLIQPFSDQDVQEKSKSNVSLAQLNNDDLKDNL